MSTAISCLASFLTGLKTCATVIYESHKLGDKSMQNLKAAIVTTVFLFASNVFAEKKEIWHG